jgi:hypothetical protein
MMGVMRSPVRSYSERLADELLARCAEHLAQVAVAVHNRPLARYHEPDGRQIEGQPVVDVHRDSH